MTLEIAVKWMVILVIVLPLLAAQASGQQTPGFGSQKEKVSYGIGVDMARNLQRQGIQVSVAGAPSTQQKYALDLDLVIRGFKDASLDQKLLVNEREIRRVLITFQGELRRAHLRTGTVPSEVNKKEGEAFLAENKTKQGVKTLPSGLQYKILKAGDGKRPTNADTVAVNFRGTFIDGTEFDSSSWGQPKTFKVAGEVIPGLAEALKLMPVGSRWQLFIPSELAYGDRGTGIIGPNEMLIFELELVAIK